MKNLLLFFSVLTLIFPGIALADLILLNKSQAIQPAQWMDSISYGNSESKGSTLHLGDQTLNGAIDLPQFNSSLGILQETSFSLSLHLDRIQWTEIQGCEFGNYFPPDPYSAVYNLIDFLDGGFQWRIHSPSDDSGLIYSVPLEIDEVASSYFSTKPSLGFYDIVCPDFVETDIGPLPYDRCYSIKDSPRTYIHSNEHVFPGPSPKYVGVNSINVQFGSSLRAMSGFIRKSDKKCNVDATLEGYANIGGTAVFRGYYQFAPAVDIFVSDTINNYILRFRSNGQDMQREIFIPSGEGDLDEPSGMVFTPEGDLLVASRKTDSFNPIGPRILRYNGQTGEFLGVFAEDEQLSNPISMVYGPDGHLFVLVEKSYGLELIERVLRFNGQSGEFMDVFATLQCGVYNPSCGLEGAWDLVFGPYGDLYVSAFTSGKVLRFDGITGVYKDIFIDNVPTVRDIMQPEGMATFYLLIGGEVKKYKIDPNTREGVYFEPEINSPNLQEGAAVAMGPIMRLESISTIPSIFAASGDGVFNYSPTGYSENELFSRGIGFASDVIVRPHVMQTVSRNIDPNYPLINFGEVGLGVSVQFAEVTSGGILSLAVANNAPGPDATGYRFLNSYYEFSVHEGLSYTGDVEICIDIPPGIESTDAQIMRWDGSNWQNPLSSSIDDNQTCATFPSLSWFGIAIADSMPGDVNGDNCVDRFDYYILVGDIRDGAPNNLDFDLNGDGVVNIADARFLVTLFTNPRGAACN